LVRKSELLNARWEHVHLDEGLWEIPAENSKTGKPHLVFLSRQAIEVFRELRFLSETSPLVLPGRSSLDKPFAHNALNHALDGVTFPITHFTIHDMRRTASTLLHERGFVSDVIEKALNHTMGGVRGVYNRAEYADQRRDMLQWWGGYVDSLAVGELGYVRSVSATANCELEFDKFAVNRRAAKQDRTDALGELILEELGKHLGATEASETFK
jgi:hypothetical protein